MTILAARLRLSTEERMQRFDHLVRAFGYRAPTKDDLVPGAELVMIDVERYVERGAGTDPKSIYGTRVRLDDKPIKPSNADHRREVVFYHCIMPPWDGQCFVPLDSFIASGYVRGDPYANDTRYLVKV